MKLEEISKIPWKFMWQFPICFFYFNQLNPHLHISHQNLHLEKDTYIIIHHIFQIVVPFFYITFSSMQAGIGDNPDRVQSKSPSPDIHIFCHMFQGLGLMSR